ncbi:MULTISPECIES: DUF6221 family protein [Streptomyces]|nr:MULTISPECIES: DUF6221 family protein [Streptomyces]KOG78714.1 hypothetical protein ADK33_25690 [Streptomyces griseus subsp. rhodochrous]KUJ35958.1 hypothetical protein ACZ90_70660 [Streptomyces albus subsp. albus]
MSGLLPSFVTARLDDDERTATAPSAASWATPEWRFSTTADGAFIDLGTIHLTEECGLNTAEMEHVALQDPARALREVKAKRQLVDLYESAADRMDQAMRNADTTGYQEAKVEYQVLRRVLLAEAAVYADHQDYLPEWTP